MTAGCFFKSLQRAAAQKADSGVSPDHNFLSSECSSNRNIFVMASPATTAAAPPLKRCGTGKNPLRSQSAARSVAFAALASGLTACGFLPPLEVFRAEFWSNPADPPWTVTASVERPPAPSEAALPRPAGDPRVTMTGVADLGSKSPPAAPANQKGHVEGDGMVQQPKAPASPVTAAAEWPAAPASTPEASSQRLSTGGPAVHLGSYRTRAEALRAWPQLVRAFPDLLDGLAPDVRETPAGADGQALWRLIAGTARDEAAAVELCQALNRQHQFCRPIDGNRG